MPDPKDKSRSEEERAKELDRELDEALEEPFPASDPIAVTPDED